MVHDNDGSDRDERLGIELALLESMYPDQIKYNDKGRELNYTAADHASFTLRLPDGYLNDALPEVLSASAGMVDLRNQFKAQIGQCGVGEEVLDSIILSFDDLAKAASTQPTQADDQKDQSLLEAKATIIVWLHHLLNTNKRKQALSPPSADVSGVTKPGYPGVLIYSGPAQAVHEHVDELKHQNWQAFQIRLEDDEEWHFAHGSGVREVEAMKDVVAAIGEQRRKLFMEAMRIK